MKLDTKKDYEELQTTIIGFGKNAQINHMVDPANSIKFNGDRQATSKLIAKLRKTRKQSKAREMEERLNEENSILAEIYEELKLDIQ